MICLHNSSGTFVGYQRWKNTQSYIIWKEEGEGNRRKIGKERREKEGKKKEKEEENKKEGEREEWRKEWREKKMKALNLYSTPVYHAF